MKRRTLLQGMLASTLLGGSALTGCRNASPLFRSRYVASAESYYYQFLHPLFPAKQYLQFTPEQVFLGPNKRLPGKTNDPCLFVKEVREKVLPQGFTAVLKGLLDDQAAYPFTLEISADQLAPWLYEIRGRFRSLPVLPAGLSVIGFCPCFESRFFAHENTFPTRMGEQVFVMTRNKGFQWLMDAKRWLGSPRAPWYQMLPTSLHPEQSLPRAQLSQPIVGWVSKRQRLMIALYGQHSYETGSRLAPCLHNNVRLTPDGNGGALPFVYRLYIGPPHLSRLRYLLPQTGPDVLTAWRKQALEPSSYPQTSATPVALQPTSLWPYTQGQTLLPIETRTLGLWKATGGTLSMAPPARHQWDNGNLHRKAFPADVYEGRVAFLWKGEVSAQPELRCSLPAHATKKPRPTHISLYLQSQIRHQPLEVELRLERQGQVLARRSVQTFDSTSQRALLPLGKAMSLEGAALVLKVVNTPSPRFQLLFDDFRWYVSQHTLSVS